jgi:murein DD-endopeptidase MepM/ murein hydrolase activator NlpD
MRVPLVLLAALAIASVALSPATANAQLDAPWNWPVASHRIRTPFDASAGAYGAGHRGIDIEAQPGAKVSAVAAGTVSFVGEVAGVPTVTITHGLERSSYQPVVADVQLDQAIDASEAIGHLAAAVHPSCHGVCLHLGRRRDQTYLDPAELLSGRAAYRLIDPSGPAPSPPRAASGKQWLSGPVTSPFGMRRHPITGVWKLHDGVDIGAPCGTPVPAAANGVVDHAQSSGAYGLQVQVRHTGRWSTSYSHLQRAAVSAGQSVTAGETIGFVGSTGLSTGCHLHAMSILDGAPVNPFDTEAKLAG